MTQEYLKEWFSYKEGNLYWLKFQKGLPKTHVGEIAGSKKLGTCKYLQININKEKQLIHRAIFLWHHGFLPKSIDHIDGNPLNNRIENLREASHSQNMMNVARRPNGTSKYKGVTRLNRKYGTMWVAHITINGKKTYLGQFKNERSAALTYLMHAQKHHGSFLNAKPALS